MPASTLLTSYLASGLDTNKPTTDPNIPAGASSFYFAVDSQVLYSWTGAAWVPLAQGTPPLYPTLASAVTLTAAQISALTTTHVTVIPALGAGRTILPLGIYARYLYGGTPFSASSPAAGVYYGNTVTVGANIAQFGSLTASASRVYGWPLNYPELAGSWDNQPVVAANPGGALSGGNGTLSIMTLYTSIPS